MSGRPRIGERGPRRYKTIVIRLLRDQSSRETDEFILSGEYARLSAEASLPDRVGHELRSYDLFLCILDGYNLTGAPLDVAYRIAAFRAFVRARTVLQNWRHIVQVALELEDDNPFLTIVAANVREKTWIDMTEGVMMLPLSDKDLKIVYTYILTFARRIVPLVMVDAMQDFVNNKNLEKNPPFTITVGPTDTRGNPLSSSGRNALQQLLRAERRVLCLRELRAFAIGIIGMHLSTFVILFLSREVVPCFDHYERGDPQYIINDAEALEVIEDVRQQQHAAEARRLRAHTSSVSNDGDDE